MKILVILSTQRSGSTMVCDDIAGTGKLGRPSEYFIKVIDAIEKSSPEELKDLIHHAMEKGRTDNGVTAVKVMANQIRPIGRALQKAGICSKEDSGACFYEFFKDAVFARVIRQDKVAQAVSRVMAMQTDVYHSADNLQGLEGMLGKVAKQRDESKLQYDREGIYQAMNSVKKEEEFLSEYVKKYSLSPLELVYEKTVKDRNYVMRIADIFEISDAPLSERRLKKVSGKISDQWINNYKSEVRGE